MLQMDGRRGRLSSVCCHPKAGLAPLYGCTVASVTEPGFPSVTAHEKSPHFHAIEAGHLQIATGVDERERDIFPTGHMCDQKVSISLTGPERTSRSD